MFGRLLRAFLLIVLAVSVLNVAVLMARDGNPMRQLGAHILAAALGAVVAVPAAYFLARHLAPTFAEVGRDRDRLRAVLSGMVEGVVAFDAEQTVVFANDRASTLLEFPPGSAVGKKLGDLIRQPAVWAVAEKGLALATPHREELDWDGPSARSLAVYVTRLGGPTHTGGVMVLHDTTELRRLERLRQEFVANVSHELKTPLANIQSSVEVLLDGAVDDPAVRGNFLVEIDDAARRLGALVMDLLSLARLESGNVSFEFGPVNVDEAVHACLDRHRTRGEAKRHILTGVALKNAPASLAVWADEEAVAQLLDNLVDNAIKYTPDGGRVTVRWSATPQHVCLEVADTGIGIPAADLPRLFERFYRVDKARSRAKGGTGLGLSIVKHMTQALGGTVSVTSVVDEGTIFQVRLPRAGG